MTRVTRSGSNQASAWTHGPMRLRQGGMEHATLPEAISPVKTCDRLLHASRGRFAGFAHVVVFVVQTPTA
jgi:hypothetical protein